MNRLEARGRAVSEQVFDPDGQIAELPASSMINGIGDSGRDPSHGDFAQALDGADPGPSSGSAREPSPTKKPRARCRLVKVGPSDTEASDGTIKADLSVPRAMGGLGKPGTTPPEHLFAAAYAACFGGALDYVATQHKKDAANAKIVCAVSIGPREGGGSP